MEQVLLACSVEASPSLDIFLVVIEQESGGPAAFLICPHDPSAISERKRSQSRRMRQSNTVANKQDRLLHLWFLEPGARYHHAAVVIIVNLDVESITAEHVAKDVCSTFAIAGQ